LLFQIKYRTVRGMSRSARCQPRADDVWHRLGGPRACALVGDIS